MRFAIALMLLVILPLSHAAIQSAEVTADINSDLSVRSSVTYSFSAPLNSDTTYSMPNGARDISVTSNGNLVGYDAAGNMLNIHAANLSTLTIEYTSGNVVFRSDSSYNFFTELEFDEPIGTLEFSIMLPEGHVIYNNFYTPDNATVSTNGRQIIITWVQSGVFGRQLFGTVFSNPSEKADPFVFIAIVLVLLIVIGAVYFRKKTRESFMKGFREDEKRTIEFLQLKKVALQSDLQKQFGFSRAKATRIIMNLEQKKLVRKEHYGRTNRLHWIG